MKKLNGYLAITRPGTLKGDCISVQFTDRDSGCVALSATIDTSQFMRALTALNIECEFTFNDSGLVGKVAEHKTEQIKCTAWPGNITDERRGRLLKPFEVDGWVGDRGDFGDHRKLVSGKKNTVNVGFRRYVEKP